MGKIELATSWMEKIAADDTHGYDQINRWGPDYDCSSAVITAWEQAGVPVKTKGATYTGNMYSVFKKCGFEDVTAHVNVSTGAALQRGDVLLNKVHHVAMFCGNRKEVEASINENGKATYGKTGDQTGKEFLVRSYRNYPWDCVLRYKGDDNGAQNETLVAAAATYFDSNAKKGMPFVVNASTLNMRTDATTDNTKGKIMAILPRDTKVYWYGYYKLDTNGEKWLYVTNGQKTGYCSYKYLK